jgi:tRNA-specific adenosine deaminase 2
MVDVDGPMSTEGFMRLALSQAQEALDAGEVPVGCVYVLDGAVVAAGRNETNAAGSAVRHAEIVAYDRVCESVRARFQDVKLYVTVEPCIMCAAALQLMGIGEVVFGCHNDRFGGCGSVADVNGMVTRAQQDTARSINDRRRNVFACTSGVLKDDAISVLQRFYARENHHAPEEKRKVKGKLVHKN